MEFYGRSSSLIFNKSRLSSLLNFSFTFFVLHSSICKVKKEIFYRFLWPHPTQLVIIYSLGLRFVWGTVNVLPLFIEREVHAKCTKIESKAYKTVARDNILPLSAILLWLGERNRFTCSLFTPSGLFPKPQRDKTYETTTFRDDGRKFVENFPV